MPAATPLRKPKATIGGLIDQMSDLREERRKIAAQDKLLSAEYEGLEIALIGMLKAENTDRGASKKASASISVEDSFGFDQAIDDKGNDGFQRFMTYVAKHKYFHLLQRRLSAPSVRELFANKGSVPGLVPFQKEKINLRNL
jgi:hypothetical protein